MAIVKSVTIQDEPRFEVRESKLNDPDELLGIIKPWREVVNTKQ